MDIATVKSLLAVTAIAAGIGVAHAQDAGPRGERMTFEALDADGSGEITAGDLEALRTERFAEIDADGDGAVTLEEFTAHAERRAAERAAEMFARLDADDDGALSRDVLEGRMGRGPGTRLLDRFDTDASGGISAEEFDRAREAMAERRGGWHGRGHGSEHRRN